VSVDSVNAERIVKTNRAQSVSHKSRRKYEGNNKKIRSILRPAILHIFVGPLVKDKIFAKAKGGRKYQSWALPILSSIFRYSILIGYRKKDRNIGLQKYRKIEYRATKFRLSIVRYYRIQKKISERPTPPHVYQCCQGAEISAANVS
jgi:hypothetical protein